MNEALTSAEIAGWRAFYLVKLNPASVQSLVDADVENKLRAAFGKHQRERWRLAHGR